MDNGGFAVAHADIEQRAPTSPMRVGEGALHRAFAASVLRLCPPYGSSLHPGSGVRHFFSLRLPEAYSLSSQITHLPSWATYLEISGTVFCPWSSKVTGPTMES